MTDSEWIANRTGRWLGIVFVGIAVAFVLTLLAMSKDGVTPLDVTLFLLLIAVLVFAVRYLRSGLHLDATGFISRGDFWTRKLRWSDVVDVELRGFRVGARLADGRWLPLFFAQRLPPERDELFVALRSRLSPTA